MLWIEKLGLVLGLGSNFPLSIVIYELHKSLIFTFKDIFQ